jgi:hypothetical protein
VAKKSANGVNTDHDVIARIEEMRDAQGMSQAEFGRRLFPKSPELWNKLVRGKENRKLKSEHVTAAALILKTKPYILYGGSEQVTEPIPQNRIVLDNLPAGLVRDLKNLAANDLRTLENYIHKVLAGHADQAKATNRQVDE